MPTGRPRFRALKVIISCEHGGNRVPAAFRHWLSPGLLASHRGYDAGALSMARDFARASRAPLFYSTVSRLLVDLNRSIGNPTLFSLDVSPAERESLLRRHYRPYRSAL